ncbi:MAG: hypothetical protein H7A23_12360 [Leptospiraceae bacterium]|nr:hypothetical protein [Leptospiraceae bacterium]MCP5495341.1 hypothetical protein [Leptospiraceae bacterium]
MRTPIEDVKKIVKECVDNNKIISLQTYLLSDYGEKVLKIITETVLTKFNRQDLIELSYSAAKELLINATKANVKRIIFKDKNLDIRNEEDYKQGMSEFKDNLREDKFPILRPIFKKYQFPVTITYYYTPYVLNIKVKNNFPLLEIEERRIRDKFQKAKSFSSLLDFYMEFGDDTEGAGMGITMVGLMLDESGIDRHGFSLYSSEKYNETVAKLEIPLSEEYISKRKVFDMELKSLDASPEELRKAFKYNYKHFTKVVKKHASNGK